MRVKPASHDCLPIFALQNHGLQSCFATLPQDALLAFQAFQAFQDGVKDCHFSSRVEYLLQERHSKLISGSLFTFAKMVKVTIEGLQQPLETNILPSFHDYLLRNKVPERNNDHP